MTAQAARPPVLASPTRARLVGLDGIRGLAALFVMLHHCWLMSFPGYPNNTGPATGWLLYGHFAVVVFIVLSGFSLAVSPARYGWQLGGVARFAHRRAWRILPPYWAALAFSLIIAWTVIPQPNEAEPTAKSVAVYGLLLQDLFGATSPTAPSGPSPSRPSCTWSFRSSCWSCGGELGRHARDGDRARGGDWDAAPRVRSWTC